MTAALTAGQIPAGSGEKSTLRTAGSPAAGTPASLRDDIPGPDRRNLHLVTTATRHAAGHRP